MTSIPPDASPKHWYYADSNNQPVGPETLESLQLLLQNGLITVDALVCQEGGTDWLPLSSILPSASKNSEQTALHTIISPSKPIETNVKQGGVIGGWVCFLLAVLLMFLSMWSFVFYIPLFLAAAILSIVAMAQRRVLGGLLLLLATIIVPAILGVVLFANRTSKFAEDLKQEIQNQNSTVTLKSENNQPPSAAGSEEADSSHPSVAVADNPRQSKYVALDEKNGFREFQLGASFDSLSGVKMEKLDGNISGEVRYDVQVFDKTIGVAEISSIQLVFSQELLKRIIVHFSGKMNEKALEQALISAYGQPEIRRDGIWNTQVWEGDNVVLSLNSRMATFADFSSKKVNTRIDKLIEEKAKAGAAEGAKSL